MSITVVSCGNCDRGLVLFVAMHAAAFRARVLARVLINFHFHMRLDKMAFHIKGLRSLAPPPP